VAGLFDFSIGYFDVFYAVLSGYMHFILSLVDCILRSSSHQQLMIASLSCLRNLDLGYLRIDQFVSYNPQEL